MLSPSFENDADHSPESHVNSTTTWPAHEAKHVSFHTKKATSVDDSPRLLTPLVDLQSIVASRHASCVAAMAVSAPVTGASTALTPALTASVPALATAGVLTRSSKRWATGIEVSCLRCLVRLTGRPVPASVATIQLVTS